VTKVEEWTRAETGVGAAIALGNQVEKGICALLVKVVVNNINIIVEVNHFLSITFHLIKKKLILILHKNSISPKRFIKKVKVPELFL
jgi:hypothetical protein